jgi:signal transduction histidine kinase
MRLLTKTFIYYIGLAAGIFAVGGLVTFFLISHIFYKQVDEGLTTEKEIIAEEIENNSYIPDYSARFGHQIEVVLLNKPITPAFSIKDTIFSVNNIEEKYRFLYFCANKAHGKSYSIKIFHPLSETNDLIEDILIVTFIMFLCLFLLVIAINYIVSKKLWIPFYNTIHQLNSYNINEKKTLTLEKTNIYEFNILNRVLNNMANKITADYTNMKEFIENASHEIQTPLAIIKSKIEILFQTQQLDRNQMEAIQVINDEVHRLSKINSGLIFLSKLDNQQFTQKEKVNLISVINNILEIFDDLIAMKNIQVTKTVEAVYELELNPELSEIMVSNLLSNAIKHNINGGFISITQNKETLVISNSGLPLTVPEKELFKRFVKNNQGAKSLGLGLAIIKKICDLNNIVCTYSCNNSVHTFELSQK